MHPLALARPGKGLRILCLGAHSDDMEIGAGGTILNWIAAGAVLEVHWCVASAAGPRESEARASAADFLKGVATVEVHIGGFRDGYLPAERAAVKDWVEGFKRRLDPDVVLTHRRDDAHQDHRLLCELAWNAFRDHLVLEVEIPKWDGDLGQPNLYVPLPDEILLRKVELLQRHFGTQRSKAWFDAETFMALARLRGVECRARYAEGFFARKLLLTD
ncbi:PIG-L deacetylase family protein [Ancylobacter mangrovi]|uniref:PIG-L family deacetylase n=1 Tax=Ancylobacter mangrovi TaxID=2972472 RepID=A0A9X2T2M1_9HYPH|nr:PIG-L deacetylase family protein [Ancylobacter mangrovi]MCS0493956.1 PIG-L family deacetylase [Ancylobacter mangrovi]MCS0501278.1 PIG-L family deacetylase [Ancylobacter mangrovi]